MHGEIVATDADGAVAWTNPLAALPVPDGDVAVLRAGPGWPDPGEMVIEAATASARFRSTLPRRYGDTGALHGQGLWANGTWLPMHGADSATWTVSLHVPAGVVVVLDGALYAETTEVRWTGVAPRLSLVVLPAARAPITGMEVRAGHVTFVGRAAQRPNVQKQVRTLLEQAWPWSRPPELVVVSDRDRRKLATAGPGVVYLSDRAFRLSPGLSRFHWPAVRRALFAAGLGELPAWDAAVLATLAAEDLPAPKVEKALGWAAWNPIIDELLTDGTLPFYEDTFSEAHAAEPDALLAAQGRRDPRAAALQARDALTPASLAPLVEAALSTAPTTAGGPVRRALRVVGLHTVLQDAWLDHEDAESDYAVVREGPTLRVERRAGVVPEPVVVEVDGYRETELWGPAPEGRALPEGARQVAVDPDRHVRDGVRPDNRAPPRWRTIVTGWATDISPSQGSFTAWGDVAFRKDGDTQNVFVVGAQHTPRDLVSFDLAYVRYLGPLVDRRYRQHRLSFAVGPSILDPSYRDTEAGDVVLDGGVGYAWDTRAADTYAFRGRRLSVGLGSGVRLRDGDTWTSTAASWVELTALHPRHVLATRLRLGWASGEVDHRLLTLGGADAVRAVTEGETVGNLRAVANIEYRASVVRDASLPVALAWLSEIQVVPGVDVGAVGRTEGTDAPVAAVGANLGMYAVLDVFGARPTLVGAVTGFPVWPAPSPVPQLYVSFDHTF